MIMRLTEENDRYQKTQQEWKDRIHRAESVVQNLEWKLQEACCMVNKLQMENENLWQKYRRSVMAAKFYQKATLRSERAFQSVSDAVEMAKEHVIPSLCSPPSMD